MPDKVNDVLDGWDKKKTQQGYLNNRKNQMEILEMKKKSKMLHYWKIIVIIWRLWKEANSRNQQNHLRG